MHAVVSALSNEPVFRDYSLLSKVADHISIHRDQGSGSTIIIVTIDEGCITLSGQVESISHRRLAEVLMWWTEGCEFVDNQLQIVPPERDTDNEITDAVRIVLEKDPLVHAGQLLVGTAAGVVMMNARSPVKQKRNLPSAMPGMCPGWRMWWIIFRRGGSNKLYKS